MRSRDVNAKCRKCNKPEEKRKNNKRINEKSPQSDTSKDPAEGTHLGFLPHAAHGLRMALLLVYHGGGRR